MPPIRSSRPGARVTKTGTPPAKSPCGSVVSPASRPLTRRTNSSVSAGPCLLSGSVMCTLPPQPAPFERRAQQRLDLCLYPRVRVADPGHVRLDRQRRAQLPAFNVRDDDARLARDQLRAEVVRVAADAERAPALPQQLLHQRPQVGREAVVPRHQLVELPAARRVLVFKTVSL